MSLRYKIAALFTRLYWLDQKLRAKLPSPVRELIGGVLLSLAAGSFVRATAISAGYEALVDQHNLAAKDGLVDFLIRQAAIVACFFVL